MPSNEKHLIIIVHGIRDPGFWQEDLKAHFESFPHTTVVSAKPDVIDVIRFILPIDSLRNKPLDRVRQVIENAIGANPGAKVTIIAHSFGTWMVSRILHEDTNISIDQLILCGGIVPSDFRWDRVHKINFKNHKNHKIYIINEHSPLDFWPLAAEKFSWGYGYTGSTGIGGSVVCDRRHVIPHSGYLNTKFAKKYWDPFIFENKIVPSTAEPVKAPWYFFLTRMPFNYMTAFLILAFAAISLISFYGLNHTGNLEVTRLTYKPADITLADGRTEVRFPIFELTNNDYLEIYQHKDLRGDPKLKAHSIRATDRFEMRVRNRPPIGCDDDSGIAWTDHKTDYHVRYVPQSWWRNIVHGNWSGTVRMEIAYEPTVGDSSQKTDRLIIKSASGIAPGTSILVDPSHDPDNCLDAELRHQMYAVPREYDIAYIDDAGFFDRIFGVSLARAADGLTTRLKSLLSSRDNTARTTATRDIRRAPEALVGSYSDLLGSESNPQVISDVLSALVASKNPEVIFSPDVLDRVFELTWSDDPKIRSVARRYLRTEMVARTNVTARFMDEIVANMPELSGNYVDEAELPTSERRYLALIALRDVYYNMALYKIDNTYEFGGDGPPIDSEIDNVISILEEGERIAKLASPETRYAFAKITYAKALSLFRYTRVKMALAEGDASENGTPRAIQSDLVAWEAENLPIGLGKFRARDAHSAFIDVLKQVEGYEENYAWPHHLKQAQTCSSSPDIISFDCLKNG